MRQSLTADLCVVGAGIGGISAALEAARLGRSVVLVDSAPALGGAAVGAIVGTLGGLFTHGPNPRQLTHGIADDLIRDLTAGGSLHRHESTFYYDEVGLGRWIERQVEAAGIRALVGAVLVDAAFTRRRVRHLDLATRLGAVTVEAGGYVDASGDASLCCECGFELRESGGEERGSLTFVIEGYDAEGAGRLNMPDVRARLAARGADYGLAGDDGPLVPFPGRDFMLANVTKFQPALDPLGTALTAFEGRRQADTVVRFLRAEFPAVFAHARVRAYGTPGRHTRWIVSRRHLTHDEMRAGARPPDAVARCAWPADQPGSPDAGRLFFLPLGCMLPRDADNLIAASRSVDADTRALPAIRAMGPLIAMGAAAAHSLDMAGSDAVHAVDTAALQRRLAHNLD